MGCADASAAAVPVSLIWLCHPEGWARSEILRLLAVFCKPEFRAIGDWIVEVVDGLAAHGENGNAEVEAAVRAKVAALCGRFPIYPGL